jgi:hypothetical protein
MFLWYRRPLSVMSFWQMCRLVMAKRRLRDNSILGRRPSADDTHEGVVKYNLRKILEMVYSSVSAFCDRLRRSC